MSQDDEYMTVEELIEVQKEETRDIIQALLDDGSDPDSLYDIEHHFFSEEFERLEPLAIEAFKMGFEVQDAEETEDEDGNPLVCCDAVMPSALKAELIDDQVAKMVTLAEKYDVIYDGWGTYYEGEDALYPEEDDDE